MKSLKTHSYFHKPPHAYRAHEVHFAVHRDDEDDELIQAIASQSEDEKWDLSNPDGHKLEEYWTHVVEDVEKDPTWIKFAEE